MVFIDTFGVAYSEDRQALVKCPSHLTGSYTISPMTNTIGKEAFKGCSLADIVFSSNVRTIQSNAFDDCKYLENIHYDGTLTEWLSIEWNCFMRKGYNLYIRGSLLSDVIIDSGIKEIKKNAFYYCQSLKHLEIQEGVCFIRSSAFNKTNIEGDLAIPNTVADIGDYAFLSCKNLKNITIRSAFTNIGVGVFRHCSQLESISIIGNSEYSTYYSIDGVLYKRNEYIQNRRDTEGNKITEKALQNILVHYPCNKKANRFVVPSNIDTFSDFAFSGIKNLTLVFDKFVRILPNTFDNANVKIQIPNGTKQQFVDGKYPTNAIEEVWKPLTIDKNDLPNKCLDIIANNPYRILGVYSNCSLKEITANKTKASRYASVGKSVSFDNDIVDLLPQISRTSESIDNAFSDLSLPLDKLKYSLFWFANDSTIDGMALEYIQAGNSEKALELFGKRENWSSLINRGVLSFISGKIMKAIRFIMTVIHNEDYRDALVLSICGETFHTNEMELSHIFIDLLRLEITDNALLSVLYENGFYESVDYVKKNIIISLVVTINREIEKTKNIDNNNAESCFKTGDALMNNTKNVLNELKFYAGTDDINYQSLANNIAKITLQLGINYHNASGKAVNYDKALSLVKYAESIAESKLIKDRCSNNLRIMQNNSVHVKTKNEEQFVINKLNAFKNVSASLSAAQQLIDDCRPALIKIKEVMGEKDSYYLNISSSVANCALGMVITIVNDSQKNDGDRRKRKVVDEAQKVIELIGQLDMSNDENNHYVQNKNTLGSIKLHMDTNKKNVVDIVLGWAITPYVIAILPFGIIGGFIGDNFLSGFGYGCLFGGGLCLIDIMRRL